MAVKGRASLLVLAALAAAVAALVWWDAHRPAKEPDRLLPGFAEDHAQSIDVEAKGGVTHLRKRAGVWMLDGGLRADGEAVEALLGELAFAQLDRRVVDPDADKRKVLGVDAPRVRLTVDGKRLALGNDDPSGHWVYVAREGERNVLVAEHRLLETAERAPPEWRSLRLVASGPDAIHTLALGTLSLARGRGQWMVGTPPMRADARKVDQVLAALDRARANRVLDGDSPSGGQPLTVDGRTAARLLGACPGHARETEIAVEGGGRLCFADAALAPLLADPTLLRDRRSFAVALDDVTGVSVKRGETTLKLARDNGIWRAVAPLDQAGPVEDARVRDWLKALLGAEARGFGPPGTPIATVELRDRAGAVERVTFGRRDAVVTAQREGEPLALELDPALARGLESVAVATLRR